MKRQQESVKKGSAFLHCREADSLFNFLRLRLRKTSNAREENSSLHQLEIQEKHANSDEIMNNDENAERLLIFYSNNVTIHL